MVCGQVFDIQRFCVHDGPGIRTTVFLKGCPLRCTWCHNPESQRIKSEMFFSPEVCIDCRACEKVCPQSSARRILNDRNLRRKHCEDCLRCAGACPSGAIERIGIELSVEEVLAEVDKDQIFFNESGGGMTLSGGEPLAQPAFCTALVKEAYRRGIHTCIQTCGDAKLDDYLNVLPYTHMILWDIKDTDPQRFTDHTGADLKRMLNNLRALDAEGARIVLRLLLIKDVNLTESHIENLINLYKRLENVLHVEIIPYHPLGQAKSHRLAHHDGTPAYQAPSRSMLQQVASTLEARGIPCVVL
jgi:glycyl-radical enzyme activating protein